MDKPRVLITTYYLLPGDANDRVLQEAGVETVFNAWRGDRTEQGTVDALRGIDGVIAGSDPFTARVLGTTDRLKVIARSGVGCDAIDLKAATDKGIVVCATQGANRHAVAEWAIALLLASARKALANLSEVSKGGWTRHEGVELAGKTLGIIGVGTIGKEVAQRMSGFEMRILAYDIKPDPPFAEALGFTYVPLEQLLRESDFVTIHAALSSSTRHLINAGRLALMKPTAHIVNTSRGGLIDTQALFEALRDKKIAAAALDVFEEEPLGPSPLRGLENVHMTPHAGASTADSRAVSLKMAIEDVLRVLRGERAVRVVNPEVYDSIGPRS